VFVDTDSSKAIWLLSLEQFFTNINIPFDCQFLVAQPESDHVVVLTEVYRVSPTLPLQTYRFGNWWPHLALSRSLHEQEKLEGIYNPDHLPKCKGEPVQNVKF
jgi:hypothetical protein